MSPSVRPGSRDEGSSVTAPDETTPLLAASITAPVPQSAEVEQSHEERIHPAEQNDEDAPIPKFQIFLLSYASLVEPVAFFSIFPYINSMINNVGGIDTEDVGFYSGLIESLFSATQMCVMVFWGKASDRFGRKPVLSISLFGIAITTALFGLSTALWQMILFRCLAGVFAGTVVTVRTMLSENSTPKTQARIFSYFAFARNLGLLLGPIIGGAFEHPADKFPSMFGRAQFFHDFPYALPGFVSALVPLTATFSSSIFIKETLNVRKSKDTPNKEPMSTWELINYPGIRQVLFIFNYVMMLAMGFTAIFPVFMFTTIPLGGLELSPGWIATFMSVGGLAQSLWLLVVFPWLHKRVGTEGVVKFSAVVWPCFFAIDPLCNLFLRRGLKPLFWTVFGINNVVGCGVAMAFAAVQLAVNDIAPSPETLGVLNAIALGLQSGLRAIIPALSTSLYATGVKYHILGGQFFWAILVVAALGLSLVIRILPEKLKGKPKSRENGTA
ncbi:unnamed protein product [Periconia digitata]|uniref:Major facilitator superfamily (MFS) profile domain-containing protein n=1 Tax=Periconia digitata TaxID=1303443 RepID=A0A9W4UD52_9PLEO|nr:unnamed protein product [Periconia digitata]